MDILLKYIARSCYLMDESAKSETAEISKSSELMVWKFAKRSKLMVEIAKSNKWADATVN